MSATSDEWTIPTTTSDGTPINEWIARAAKNGYFVVASEAERATLLTTLDDAGIDNTYVHVVRLDADENYEHEYTIDGGTNWLAVKADAASTDGWTPTYTNFSVGDGTVTTRVQRRDGWVFASWKFVFGSTTSVTGTINISLPESVLVTFTNIGTCYLNDASASGGGSRKNGWVQVGADASICILRPEVDEGDLVNNTTPWTWAVGDQIGFTIAYPYI